MPDLNKNTNSENENVQSEVSKTVQKSSSENEVGAAPKGMSQTGRHVLVYAVLIFLTFLCLFWFYVLFVNATRSHAELNRGFAPFFSKYGLMNFFNLILTNPIKYEQLGDVNVFSSDFLKACWNSDIIRGLFNSTVVAASTAALSVYFSTMTAFAIHAYDFKLKKVAFMFILAIMMIPTQISALGFLRLIRMMKLMDNFLPLIIPAIAAPVTFFYLKQYMDSSLPHELLESARIDGAGELRIFNTIALPLMKPAISVQLIFAFVGSWNNYFTPNLILESTHMKTLPIMIAQLRTADYLKFDMGKVNMMIALSILPVIIVYVFLAKYIVGGMTVGAVKG